MKLSNFNYIKTISKKNINFLENILFQYIFFASMHRFGNLTRTRDTSTPHFHYTLTAPFFETLRHPRLFCRP